MRGGAEGWGEVEQLLELLQEFDDSRTEN